MQQRQSGQRRREGTGDAFGLLGPVPERDLLSAHRAVIAEYDENGGERSMERTVGLLCSLFPPKSSKPARIMVRMQALKSVWDHPLMKAWKANGVPGGGSLVEETILKVAATHPLIMTATDIGFNPDSFFEAVLRRAKREGSG